MKFEIFKSKDGYRFRLIASNGKIVATSEGYKRKQSCRKTIDSIVTAIKSEVKIIDEV